MNTLIHVVVSCTELVECFLRRRPCADPNSRVTALACGSHPGSRESDRRRRRSERRTSTKASTGPSCVNLIADSRVKVWVASAGYGLVDVQTLVAPYAATFSSRQADSVTLATSPTVVDLQRRMWWRTLREHSSQGSGRSMAAVGADGPILVAASWSYLAAMSDELVEAEAQSSGRLVLTTTGAVPGELRHLRTTATGVLRGRTRGRCKQSACDSRPRS